MLLNVKKTIVGEVVAVKLVNGQEIITKLISIEGSTYTLSRPYVLMLVRDADGTPTVTFAPFSMGIDDNRDTTYEIDRAQMIFTPVAARADAAKQYLQTTSGIEIVGAGSIQV
jgi:hypothetical protein